MNKYAHLAPPKPEDPGARYSVVHGCKSKRRYTTEAFAQRVAMRATRQRGTPLRVYPCPLCKGWHITKRKTFA
jgi:hypothetical protein